MNKSEKENNLCVAVEIIIRGMEVPRDAPAVT